MEEERIGSIWIEHPQWGATDQAPTTRCFERVDPGLHPANRDAAGRDACSRVRKARGCQFRWQPHQVIPTRGKSAAGDPIRSTDMTGDHFVWREIRVSRDVREVGTEVTAVDNRNLNRPRWFR